MREGPGEAIVLPSANKKAGEVRVWAADRNVRKQYRVSPGTLC